MAACPARRAVSSPFGARSRTSRRSQGNPMASIDVINQDKKKVGTIDLRDDVFAVEVNVPLVHQILKAQRAGWRQGTAKTKVKSEVRGGGKKPFRQKGTGNARQGSTR